MNINEIAKLAGVSRATVSRYLNDGYVSAEKKEKIRRVIEETGYIPSTQAQMLRTKRTGLVGVIIPKINSDSISRIVAGIGDILHGEGYQLLLATTNNDEKEELEYLQTFQNNHVDGVILCGTIFQKEHKKLLKKYQVPIVIVGQYYKGEACVYHDDCNAAKEVTRLLTASCKKIAYIGVTPKDKAVGTERRKGFLTALSEAGLEEVAQEQVLFKMEEGYWAMGRILKRFPETEGVFCATDHIAIGALQYLKEKKMKCKVVGMGDSKTADLVEPKLSSVHFYYRESGKEAARVLLEMLENQVKMKKEIKMGYEVIERESTKDW